MVSTPTGVLLKFDNADCALHGVTVARTAPGSVHEAELRLQFYPCTARTGNVPPPVSGAGISIGLQKEGAQTGVSHRGNDVNLFRWMDEVCGVKPTSSPNAVISEETHYNLTQQGNASCDSKVLEVNPLASTLGGCKTACGAAYQKAKITGNEAEKCTGFAFNPTSNPHQMCILYTGAISVKPAVNPVAKLRRRLSDDEDTTTTTTTELEDITERAGWQCYSVKVTHSSIAKATPAPRGYEEYQAEAGLSETLRLKEAMGGTKTMMQEAILHQVDPPQPFCYEATWWFALQDSVGVPAHISVNAEHWDEVMKLLPAYTPESAPVDSKIIIDRVLVQTCTDTGGWGRTCVMPKAVSTCDSVQMVNAILTGLITPIVSWLVVYIVYKQVKGKDQQGDGPEAMKEAPACPGMVVVICCIAALVIAMVVSYALSTTVEKIFGRNCFHESREHMVVWLGAGGAAAVSMLVALLYLFYSSKVHNEAQDMKQKQTGPAPGKKYAIMALEPDGSATVINHNVHESGLVPGRGGAMASNMSTGSNPMMSSVRP
jgi:hypothetical protein